jgi:predicted MFS family arabinose efflux permease
MEARSPTSLSPALLSTLAATSALSAANLYYAQPLLADIGRAFNVSVQEVGFIPMLTQAGYALGILLVVPLGDVTERRRLIVWMCGLTALALVGTALAPTLAALAVASFFVGAATIVPQLVLPLAAHLAHPSERGRIVGLVMGGLLVGILAARTVSGLVGDWLGWRTMYWFAAAIMIGLMFSLWRVLPESRPHATMSYGALLRSIGGLIREQPILREASLLGGLTFGTFSAFWSTLVFRLETPPLHYGSKVAGLYGLLGISGALVAPFTGRFADRRGPRFTILLALGTALASWVVFALGGHTLIGLALGVLLIDVGAQANHISNQARIYALNPESRSRLNTVYMVSYFIGGALGTFVGTTAWSHFGWFGVCAVGVALVMLALIVFATGRRSEKARTSAGAQSQ